MTMIFDSTRPEFEPADPTGTVGPIDGATRARIAAIVIPLMFFADRAMLSSTTGLAATGLVICLSAAAATGSASPRRPATLLVPATVAALAIWLSVRASPWLIVIDLAAAGTLVLLGPSIRGWSDLVVTERFAWLARIADTVTTVGPLTRMIGRAGGGARRRVRGQRDDAPVSLVAVATSAVVGLVLLILLASGDAVFASFIVRADPVLVIPHVAIWAAAGFLGLWLAVASIRPRPKRDRKESTPVASDGSILVLATVTGVLGLFSLSQLVTVIRGRQWVVERTGLTFADYARQGFFQLLWVAAIVLAVLIVVRLATAADQHRPARSIVVLGSSAAGLTVFLVVVSLRRMFLYEAAFGLTMLRLYVMGFAVWLAAVVVATALATARTSQRTRWLGPFVISSAVAGVLLLNVVDPEALVVQRNLDRAATGVPLDIDYLVDLSADGRLRLLDEAEADPTGLVATELCATSLTQTGLNHGDDASIWSYNRATDRHATRLEALCRDQR